ncbi:MAG: PPC domain-containing DNA-binding protein [Halodesulfurarchaeum sp.]
MEFQEVSVGRTVLGTLEHGTEWGAELVALAEAAGVESGWYWGRGAVEDAALDIYDQDEFAFESVAFPEPLQVPVAVGTVSMEDGEPTVETSAVLARPSGQALAGVLERATVFSGEVLLQAFEEPVEREPGEATGAPTWTLH